MEPQLTKAGHDRSSTSSRSDAAQPSPVGHPILRLQQTIGNRAVLRLLQTGGIHPVQRSPAEPADEPSPEQASGPTGPTANAPARSLIVEDSAEALAPGQMKKGEFLIQLQAGVCTAINQALAGTGRSASDCPYLERYFLYYRFRESQHIERAIHRYVPEAADPTMAQDYIAFIGNRAHRAAMVWASTGRVTGVPEEVPPEVSGTAPGTPGQHQTAGPVNPALRKARDGMEAEASDPQAIQSELGIGKALDSDVRSRLEPIFGEDFSQVRLHTDSKAAQLSEDLSALAFTVGEHVAFGSGQYQPGTLVGDALLAHELAHVAQQKGANASGPLMQGNLEDYSGLEEDADRSALHVIASLWGGAKNGAAQMAQQAKQQLQSGLRLQRCDGDAAPVREVNRQEYERVVNELKTLYRRKQNIVEGTEPPAALPEINSRIDQLVGQLRSYGIRLEGEELFRAIQTNRDLLRVTGSIVRAPAGEAFFEQRMTFQVVLDRIPPGRTINVSWRWKAGGQEYQFLKTGARGPEMSLMLDEAFWNLAGGGDIAKARGMEILAYVYLGDEQTAVANLTTNWIALMDRVPAAISIQASESVVVQGATAEFHIADWVPPYRHYMPEWAVDGEAIEGERPILRRTFDDVGRHTVSVNLYRVRRSFGIHDKTLFRQASTTIEVQSPTEAGERLLQEMGREPAPRLSAVETSIQQSITEIEQQVARGGEQAAYWRRRLEAQRSRLEQLREHVPSLGTAQDLPSDPTALAAGMSYSGPIPAVLVMPSAGGAQPLSIYLTTRQEGNRWNARLVDITGADVWKFDGMGATPLEAYHDAFEDWMDDHPYPRGGRVVYRFSPPGWTLGSSFGTTTVWNTAKAWVDGLLTVGAVVVAGLLLAAPTAGVTQALGLILLAATVARSTVAIVENIDRGMEPLDSRNVLEGVAIVTSFVGVGGTALRQVGIRAISPVVYRTGSWLVLTSIAADAGTLVYATSEAIQQIRATQSDPTLDESQKQMAMLRLISVLLTQGLLFFVANRDMFRGGLRRSDFFATNPPATAAGAQRLPQGGPITLEPGSRLDVAAELRRAGDTPERLRTMTNDRELLDRYLTLPWLRPLPADQAADMLRRLSTSALTGLTDLTAQEARRIVNGLADDAVVNALAPELRGDRLRDLLGATTSEHVRGLHTAFGPQGLKQLIDEVGPAIIGHLLADLTPAQLRTRALELTNVVLRNLAQDLSGAQIARLVTDHGADVVRWAAGDQSGSAARELLTRLNAAAIGGLRDVSGREARQLLDQFGHQVLNAVSPTVPGSGLRDLVIHFGAESAKGIAEDRINGGKINDLITYVRNLRQASSTTGTGELVSPAPLDPHSVIVDSNYIRYLNYAQQKIASGQPLASLPPVERNVYNHYQSIAGGPTGTRDLRITNVTIAEAGPTPNVPARGGIPSINRNSQEYRDVLAALERRQLGGAGAEGAGDRAIVADAFFAGPPGYRATLVTTDRGIYNALADMAGHNPGKLGKSVPDALPNGFEVKFTVGTTQRSIWLRPISGK